MVATVILPLAVSISALLLIAASWLQQLTPITLLRDALYPPGSFAPLDFPHDPSAPALYRPVSFHRFRRPSPPLPLQFWQLPLHSVPCRDNISCALADISSFTVPSDVCANFSLPALPPPPPLSPIGLLVEGRDFPYESQTMAYLLNDALHHLPPTWLLHILVPRVVIERLLLHPLLAQAMCQHRLNAHALPPTLRFADRGQYNQVLSHNEFWRLWHGHSHVHLFELDSGYCDHPTASWDSYLQYDFCGARWGSWDDTCWPAVGNYTQNCVGNSGFSLWRQEAMEFLTRNLSMPLQGHLIDSFWTDAMRRYWPHYTPCPYDDADRFSTETFFVPKHPQDIPLGWHKPFLHRRTPEEVGRFMAVCSSWHVLFNHPEEINHLQPKGQRSGS